MVEFDINKNGMKTDDPIQRKCLMFKNGPDFRVFHIPESAAVMRERRRAIINH
jgi:hypothetical protein